MRWKDALGAVERPKGDPKYSGELKDGQSDSWDVIRYRQNVITSYSTWALIPLDVDRVWFL